MKAKKSYGQHFLNRADIARRIAERLHLTDQYEQVLEVGPGKGMLTTHLLEGSFRLTAVEADPDMVGYLEAHYPELGDGLIQGDFLKIDLQAIMQGKAFGLIGNFPYNISSQIIFKMLENRELIPEMVGMFQKEMAERIIAGPGSKTYGVIGLLTQAFYKGEYLFTVERGSFSPPPKVLSGVIRLERRREPLVSDLLFPYFRKVVKTAFGQRRKMLRNSLKPLAQQLELLNSDVFSRRPEQVSIPEFIEISQKLYQL